MSRSQFNSHFHQFEQPEKEENLTLAHYTMLFTTEKYRKFGSDFSYVHFTLPRSSELFFKLFFKVSEI